MLSIVADVERVLDDAADHLRREEVGELRGEGRDEGVEVALLVSLEAAGGPDFSYVRNIIWRDAVIERSSQRGDVAPFSGLVYGLLRHDLVRQMFETACSLYHGVRDVRYEQCA